jgi:hypothetical protein
VNLFTVLPTNYVDKAIYVRSARKYLTVLTDRLQTFLTLYSVECEHEICFLFQSQSRRTCFSCRNNVRVGKDTTDTHHKRSRCFVAENVCD